MADVKIPRNDPGIAGFATESYESAAEPRYGEGPATTTHQTVGGGASAVEFALYSVVNIDPTTGVMTMAEHDGTDSNATHILAAPAVFGANQSMSLPFYREGQWDQEALVWDASFNTDAKKQRAFEGSISPNIFIQKKKFTNSTIPV